MHGLLESAETLRRDAKRTVEFAGQVLKGDQGRKLDNAVVIEKAP